MLKNWLKVTNFDSSGSTLSYDPNFEGSNPAAVGTSKK